MAWGYFCLFYENYIVYKIFNIMMHYPQWNYITVQSFVFTSAIVSEVHLLKREKMKNNNNAKMNNNIIGVRDFLIFNTFPMQ